MNGKMSVVVLAVLCAAAGCFDAFAQAPASQDARRLEAPPIPADDTRFSGSFCDQVSEGAKNIVSFSSEWNINVFFGVVEQGLKAGKNLDDVGEALNPGPYGGSPRLWWAGKTMEGLDLLYKANKARLQPTWRDAGATALSEGSKWLAGNYVGGKLATYIIVGGPGWAVLVAIPVAWAGVMATEKLIEVAPPWISRKFDEFCKTRMAKEFAGFVQPLLLSSAKWLGIVTPSGMTLESMRGDRIVIPLDATPEQINQILAENPNFNPPDTKLMETLLNNLPPGVTTEAELEKYLQPSPGTPPDIAEAHAKSYVPAVKKAFADRRARWEVTSQ